VSGEAAAVASIRAVPDLLRRQADRIPAAAAILAPGRRPLSYRALWQQVDLVARTLAAAGLGREDRVALVAPNGPEMAVAFLATIAATACTPLNPAYSAGEFGRYMADVGATALLVQAGMPSPARAVAGARGLRILELAPIAGAEAGRFAIEGERPPTAAATLPARPHDVALALHTAGTTSRPKIVPLTHANLCASADNIRRALALTEGDRCLNVMPLFHVHGLVGALLASLAAGAGVVCAPGFSAAEFFTWLADARATWYTAVPTIHQAILAGASARGDAEATPRLRFIRSTSASLAPPVLAELERVFQAPVIEAYGTTEASIVTCNPLPPGVRKRGSVGVGAGPEIAVLDPRGRARGAEERGEIAVRGPTVIAAYEGDPEANAASFTGGWFRTGDEGYLDRDGYLFITGRLEETIKRGGESISPQEIDAVLLEHPAVAQAMTCAVPHPRLGEDIAAAVVLRPGAAASADEIRQFAASRLAAFKVPRQIVLVGDLPRSSTGKLQRLGAAERLGLTAEPVLPAPGAEAEAPATAVEEIVHGLWARALGVERIGRDDNFFALGGDSILAAQLLGQAHAILKVDIPFRRFFEAPTMSGMTRSIEALRAVPPDRPLPALEPAPRGAPLPLSCAQRRLWFLDQLGLSGHAYHLLEVVRIRGPLATGALERSLQAMHARHEVLRTRLGSRDGQPHQLVDPAAPLPVARVDLGAAPAGERANQVSALAAAEVRQPFDLAQGPLLRATLVRLGDDEHVLLLAMHHVASDGWSYAVFWRELAALYAAEIAGAPSPLPALALQYADYASWEHRWLGDDALAPSLAYWKGQLAGLSRLELATDRPRARVPTFGGARQPIAIPARLARALRRLSAAQGATTFMTLLAAFQTLLHRYSGQRDVAVGTLIAHRTRPELEGLIGFFVNTLVLRTDFTGDPTFADLLARVRDTALGAYDHQDVPFEKLVEELHPRRELGHHPLFQVLFIFQNTPRPPLELPGLILTPVEIDPGTAKFDLTLELAETPEGLGGWLEYNTDLFEAATMARMAGHLETLLEAIAADPTARVSRVPLLTAAERHQLLVEWNATAADYPREVSIPQLFTEQVERTPRAVALVDGGRQVTYEELNRSANQLAHYLGTLGVGPGVLVGVGLPRSAAVLVAMLGVLKAGGVYVPLDPAYPRERLSFILADGRLALVLTDEAGAPSFSAPGTRVACLDALRGDLARQRADDPDLRVRGGDLAYVIYTSGSTGQPKGVAAPHRQVVNRLAWMWRAYPFAPGEVACQKTALNFVDSIWECLGALLQGIPTAIVPDEVVRDLGALVGALANARVTRLWLVPSLLRALLERFPDLERRLPVLRFWVTSGEAITAELYRRFEASLPSSALYNLYGISEVWDVSWWGPPLRLGDRPRVPIGRPIANVRVYLLDGHLEPVPVGLAGEIYVGGDGLARGYVHRPDLTAERFVPDPFAAEPDARLYRTGDLARYLPDGTLDFLGRADDQVKLRGYRIEPREVELALEQHPAIGQAVVSAREDVPGELRLVAYVRGGREAMPTLTAIRHFLRARVPDYMLPVALVPVDRFPLTPSGKVDRRALPTPERARPDLEASFVAPRNATEATLAGIWAQLLGVAAVGVHDNFFELGGHSLLALQVLSRVHAATRVEVSLVTFFEAPTVAEVAHAVASARATGAVATAIPAVSRRQPLPASATQEQVWRLGQRHPGMPSPTIAYAVRLRGRLDLRVLERSLAALVARHEALRTAFRLVDGRLMQVIAPSLRVPVSLVDLRALPEPAREAETRRLARAESRRPFDPARGPLLRVHLWRRNEADHVLLVTMHHIIGDGWSMGIFLRELAALYHAGAAGRLAALPPLPIQYADFAAWQRHPGRQALRRAQLAYWRHQLRGPHRPLALAAERARERPPLARTAREFFGWPGQTWDALAALSRREGSTPFMTVIAALKILLHAYTGEVDLRVATLLAQRQHRDVEGVIGLFTNMVILRTDLGGDPPGREVLQRVRRTALQAHAHSEIPFEEVARSLERERGLRRASLSQVMVIWQNAFRLSPDLAAPPLGFLELEQGWLAPETVVTTFDLVFELREGAPGLLGSCLYNTDALDAPAVRRLVDDFRGILEVMAGRPDQRLAAFRRQHGQTLGGGGEPGGV
jgi:amino acid adenylation domain-containing protein